MPRARSPLRTPGGNLVTSPWKFGPRATRFGAEIAPCIVAPQSSAATIDLATHARIEFPPAEPIAPANRPSRVSRIVGTIEDRGRLPGATALATGRPVASVGLNEKSVS